LLELYLHAAARSFSLSEPVMEHIKTAAGALISIPDVVVAASKERELVEQYVQADAAERDRIEQRAIEALSPPSATTVTEPAAATPAAVPAVAAPTHVEE
jgi:hypothetical protein